MKHPAFPYRYGRAKYCVKYRDGAESMLMPKGIAEDYATIFDGEVLMYKEPR